jgi:hypothetical protein
MKIAFGSIEPKGKLLPFCAKWSEHEVTVNSAKDRK